MGKERDPMDVGRADQPDLAGAGTSMGKERDSMDATMALSDIPLFAGLGPPERRLIAERVRKRCYGGEITVLHREQPGGALYIILSGKVKVHNETPEGK